MSSPRPSSHAFRYEDDLCTLPDGVTLRDWRRAAPGARTSPSLLARLRARLRPERRRPSI